MPDSNAIKNIDFENRVKPVPAPDKVAGIDTTDQFYSTIIDAAQNSQLDIGAINAFSNISRSRDQLYSLLDMMGEDPIISSALDIYTADACEPNDAGQVVWAESDDANVLAVCNMILDDLNIDKNTYNWMYSLIKYGDLYLRLFRDSEYNPAPKDGRQTLTEEVILKAFSKNDHYVGYAESVKNPAEVFDLTRFGKSCGYLRTHIQSQNSHNAGDPLTQYSNLSNQYSYKFNRGDVDIYEATEFVHATLSDNSDRVAEEVSITSGTDASSTQTYKVRRGQSVLYNSFKIWRELSLLENSVMLNRLTRSSVVRTVNVEVGDMDKTGARNLLTRIKQMIEQKSALSVGSSIREYTNPGPMENVIYIPVHDGKGAITASQIGGDVQVGSLDDLNYWKKKLFASLGIPGQYLGDTDDSTGFNGGSSLSLISSRYAKTIKRIQNAYIQAITDVVNLVLLDKGLREYIGKFTIKMQTPTTQEEKDRRDNISSAVQNVDQIMSLVTNLVEDPILQLKSLKSLLSSVITDTAVLMSIQSKIDELEAGDVPAESQSEDDFGFDDDFGGTFNAAPSTDMSFNDTTPKSEEPPAPQPLDLDIEAPEESFISNGGELLTEDDDEFSLPSWDSIGISFDEYQK